MSLTRRTALVSMVSSSFLSGCSFYREPPPVVVGGVMVAKDKPIMTALRASSEHRRFVAALEESGLAAELEGIGPFTVFAPTDDAFDGLRPKSALEQMASETGILKQVMLGHIIPARLPTHDLLFAFPQLNGKTKVFALNKQVVTVEGLVKSPRLVDMRQRKAVVIRRDALAANGIIHVVDNVLLPEEEALVSP